MKKIEKMSNTEIANIYTRLGHIFSQKESLFYKHFETFCDDVEREINRRNRAFIFKEACKRLKNRHFPNQFAAASHYADAIMYDSDYFPTDRLHEIGSYYSKNENPHQIDLVMSYATIF